MKILKIVLIVFFSFIVLLAAGLSIFLKTFDLNKHIPQITDQVHKALGRDISIRQADLGFSLAHGIGIDIRGIVLADDHKFSDKPFLTVDRVNVGLDVRALLFEHKMQLTQIMINAPKMVIMRSREGNINAATMAAPASALSDGGSSQGQKAALAMPALLINDIKVTDAQVTYIDDMMTPSMAVMVDHIEIGVTGFSLASPFDVFVKAALFSSSQDIILSTKVQLDLVKQTVHFGGMKVDVDLAPMDTARLSHALPMLKPAALKSMAGKITVAVADMAAGVKGVEGLKAQVLFDQGSLVAGVIPVAVDAIQLKADIDEKMININSFSCLMAGGMLDGHVLVDNYLHIPVLSAALNVQNLDVKKFLAVYKLPLDVAGLFFGSLNVKFSGILPQEIMGSLNGDVKGELKQGVLENVNLLALGLGSIPMLPALLENVMADLPAQTQDEVKQGITRFDVCRVQARIMNGIIEVDAADMTTRDLAGHVQGTVKLAQDLDLKADLRMAPFLSERLGQSVKELAALKDDQGRIYIPMAIKGPMIKPKIIPDIEYLTKKILVVTGGDMLQKALGTPDASQAVDAIFNLFKKK